MADGSEASPCLLREIGPTGYRHHFEAYIFYLPQSSADFLEAAGIFKVAPTTSTFPFKWTVDATMHRVVHASENKTV